MTMKMRAPSASMVDKPSFTSEPVQDRPDGRYQLKHFETELRALLRDEMMVAVRGAGYEEVRWHGPEASGYYQPIVTARNR